MDGSCGVKILYHLLLIVQCIPGLPWGRKTTQKLSWLKLGYNYVHTCFHIYWKWCALASFACRSNYSSAKYLSPRVWTLGGAEGSGGMFSRIVITQKYAHLPQFIPVGLCLGHSRGAVSHPGNDWKSVPAGAELPKHICKNCKKHSKMLLFMYTVHNSTRPQLGNLIT